MTVDLTGIAVAITGGIFSVLGTVLLAIIQAKIKNQQMRELLDGAVRNSLGKIQTATDEQINRAAALHPTLPTNLAVGVMYVAAHAQDALDTFGITPAAIADKIQAKMGLAQLPPANPT